MNKATLRLVITDLDNTLYDWVSYFAIAFTAMVDKAVEILSVPRDQLLDELKEIHQNYHNSEHPFALLETPTATRKYAGLSRKECKDLLDPAFHAFNKARKTSLVCYPGVVETLSRLKQLGVNVIGHTEATIPNALFRLNKLGLSPLISRLYAVEHIGLPHPNVERENVYRLMPPPVTSIPLSQRKPNPQVLFRICSEMGVSPAEAVYLGDSITRDISMAKSAKVWAAWARYGNSFSHEAWATLVRVTYWTPADVKREELLREQFGSLQPDVTLNSFSDIVDAFTFQSSPSIEPSHFGYNALGKTNC